MGIVGDMASVMGKDLMMAVEAVADAQTGEVERLKEFGITKKMIEDQAKLMGLTVTNNKGQITDQKAFNASLFAVMEKRFKGGMEMQSKTFKGMVSNVKDFVGTVGRNLGAPIFAGASAGLQNMLGWLNQLQEDGTIELWTGRIKAFGGVVFSTLSWAFKESYKFVVMVSDKLRNFYNDHKPQIDQIGAAFIIAFQALSDFATPIIDWLRNTGLPGMVDALTEVGGWVIDVATWFIDNWSMIEPFIIGIAAAWGTYFLVTKSILLYTKIWTGVQWALNAAMTANPIGLIIVGIGLLIGAVILLVKHWDKVKSAFVTVWDFILNAFEGYVNWWIRGVNAMITGLNEAFSFDLPKWLGGGSFTLGLPTIPEISISGSHKDGLPNVPFDGYLAELHKGERENKAYSGAAASPAAVMNEAAAVSVVVEAGAIVINATEGQDLEELAEMIITMLLQAIRNGVQIMGNTSRGVLLNG